MQSRLALFAALLVVHCITVAPAAAAPKSASLADALAIIQGKKFVDLTPATGAIIVVTWPKVEAGFGFPARAFAILP